jgi:hypothetical protein
MSEYNDKESWSSYSKLVMDYLERLDENYEALELKYEILNKELGDLRNLEKMVIEHKGWIKDVNEVWSTTQMKEGKDEIYKQKTKLDIATAIVIFVQILIGIGVAVIKISK